MDRVTLGRDWRAVAALLAGLTLAGCDAPVASHPATPTAVIDAPDTPSNGAALTSASAPIASASVTLESSGFGPHVRAPTDWLGDHTSGPRERAATAFANREAAVKQLYAEAGVAYPAAEIYLRVFKADRELEVWATATAGGELTLIGTYGICAMSGKAGRKRKEGDNQAPEGTYKLTYFWPDDSFYLTAKVSYPNPFDRAENGAAPGGDIMIHGGCASIGCIALSDERMEEVWVMGEPLRQRGVPIDVHIFPAREIEPLLVRADLEREHAFYRVLIQGLERFESTKRPFVLRVRSPGGLYAD